MSLNSDKYYRIQHPLPNGEISVRYYTDEKMATLLWSCAGSPSFVEEREKEYLADDDIDDEAWEEWVDNWNNRDD